MNKTFTLEEIDSVAKEFMDFLERDEGAREARATVLGFSGNLGSGKTTFTKKLLENMGHSGGVPSPTFVLRRDYQLQDKNIIHIDAYRLENPENLYQVISKEELNNKGNLVIIEWPEKVDRNIFDHIILFEHIDENTRKISKN